MLRKIKNWFNPKKTSDKKAEMTMQLLQMLDITHDDELSCGEVNDLIDQYVELKQRGANVESLMPLVKHHLDLCRECFDEYEALMAVLEFEEAL
jgi:hypothetical protein